MQAAQPTIPLTGASTGPSIRLGELACRASWLARVIGLFVASVALSLLVTAAFLSPNKSGLGTHTGLGLGRCAFELRTGLPCMACGMTTSFAWFVRGNIAASFYIQPMGTILAFLCTMAVWSGAYIGITGRPVHRLLYSPVSNGLIVGFFTFAIVAWIWKIFIHVRGIDGW